MIRSSPTPTVFLILLLAVSCSPAAPPEDPDAPIQMVPLVTLGDADGPGVLGSFPMPSAPTADGLYLIADEGANGTIPVLDSTGTLVRTIGRNGAGPGEYRRVTRILMLPSDSIVVVDDQLRRATILAPDLSYARSFLLPAVPFDIAPLGDRLLVASSATPSRDSAIVIFDLDGSVHAATESSIQVGAPPTPYWIAADGGGFWTAQWAGPLTLRRYDSTGARIEELQPASSWVTTNRAGPVTPEQPPASQVRGSWAEGIDRLWVLASIADANWARGLGEVSQGEGGVTTYRIHDRDRVFDTIIEVIDRHTGAILATRRFDLEYRFSPFAGVVARLVESDEAGMRVELYRVSLRPGELDD